MASIPIQGLKNLIAGAGRKTVYDKIPNPPSSFANMTEKEKLQSLVMEVRVDHLQARQRRNILHYQMALYYQGYQSVELSDDGSSLDVYERDEFYIENQFRKNVDTVKSMLNQMEPEVLARPGSGQPKDIAAARASDSALDMIRENIAFDRLRDQKNLYKCLFGTAFMFTDYIVDEKYGTVVSPKFRYSEMPDPEGGPDPLITKIPDGVETRNKGIEIALVCSPLEVNIRPDVKGGIENVPYLQWIARHDIDTINYAYPGLNESPGSAVEAGLAQHYVEVLGALPGNAMGQGTVYAFNDYRARKAELARTWIMPQMFRGDKALERAFPTGVHVVTVNGRVADYYEERLADRWTMEVLIPLPHSLLGDGLYDVVLQQDQINEINSLLIKHLRFSTIGHTAVDTNVINPKDWINDPENGLIPAKPSIDKSLRDCVMPIPPNTLAPEVVGWLQMVKEATQEMSSAYDPVTGKGIGANTPYSQSVFLAEKAQSRWRSSAQFNKPEQIRFWKQLLQIARDNWIDERTQALIDNTGQWTFQQFLGADLDGNVDIRLTNTDFKPKSRAEQMQAYEQRLALDPIWATLPPRQKLQIEEALGLSPDTNPMSNQIMRAYRTIDRIKKGEVVTPLPLVDDPTVQIPIFQDWLVSEKGEDVATVSPDIYASVYTFMMTLLQMGMMAMAGGFAPHPTMGQQQGPAGPEAQGQNAKPGEPKQPAGGQPGQGSQPKPGPGQELAQSPAPNKVAAPPYAAGARK